MSLFAAADDWCGYDVDPFARYQPRPSQEAFHRLNSNLRLFRAPNQVNGKSYAGAWEALAFLLGKHRYRDLKSGPVKGMLVPYSDDSCKAIEEKLWELLPIGVLHSECRYDPDRGFRVGKRRVLRLASGSSLGFISQKAGSMASAGQTLDFVWFDEPPTPDVFAEGQARVRATKGSIWLTLTPVGRPCDWLKDMVSRGIVSEVVGQFTEEDTGLTADELAQIVAETLPAQVPQRCYGHWDGVTPNRYFAAWSDDLVLPLEHELGDRMWEVLIGIDHGEGAKKQVALLLLFDADSGDLVCWDETISDGKTDSLRDAVAIVDMLDRHGMVPEQVDDARGDHNSAGKSEAGLMANQLLEQAVAKHLGLPAHLPPMSIRNARKGPGSIEAGCGLIHRAMVRGNLRVSARCPSLIAHFAHWKGPRDGSAANKELSHVGDAARYATRDVLDTRERGLRLRFR